jgi:hypothetical protein
MVEIDECEKRSGEIFINAILYFFLFPNEILHQIFTICFAAHKECCLCLRMYISQPFCVCTDADEQVRPKENQSCLNLNQVHVNTPHPLNTHQGHHE